ncbi:MAG TPA: hypothetical protein PLC15_24985, partial [Candidatus Obscuribacter sp.]|nr:hypothetical protein [Candidatus Obscuribacter sp.]
MSKRETDSQTRHEDGGKSGRRLSGALLIVTSLVVLLIIAVIWQMLDRAEKQVGKIKSIKVAGAQGSGNELKVAESNRLAEELIERNQNERKLSFEFYDMTDQAMEYMPRLKKLEELSLAHTRITNSGLKYLTALPLTGLILTNTDIDNEGLKHIAKLTRLGYLNLSDTDVNDEGLRQLEPLKDLSDLNLAATKITDRGLPFLKVHQPIWKLVLLNTNVTDSGMAAITELKNLECLDVDSTAVTIVGLRKLTACDKLRTLNLQNCLFNDRDAAELAKLLPALSNLNISHTQLTGKGLLSLAKLPKLSRLTINRL